MGHVGLSPDPDLCREAVAPHTRLDPLRVRRRKLEGAVSFSGRQDGRARGEERSVEEARGRELAEALKDRRWHHHSAQKGAGEDQWITDDPEAEGEVLCERLELGYYSRYPHNLEAMGAEHEAPSDSRKTFAFIAHHDPPTVLALYDEMDCLRDALSASLERERQQRKALEDVYDAIEDAKTAARIVIASYEARAGLSERQQGVIEGYRTTLKVLDKLPDDKGDERAGE